MSRTIRAAARLILAGFATCAAMAGPLSAQSGEIVSLTQPALLYINSEPQEIGVGDTVEVGQTVATGRGGEVRIVFPDETRIVVGPRSQMRIDRAIFRENNTARRLAVSAAKGTFRFLSGNSNSSAYRVRTPIATMGVRGTIFDFAVPDQASTDLVVFDGRVEFCRRSGRCANVPAGCQTVQLSGQEFTQPATLAEREAILTGNFPYARQQAQARLEAAFRAAIGDCERGDGEGRVAQISLPSGTAAIVPEEREEESGGNPAE